MRRVLIAVMVGAATVAGGAAPATARDGTSPQLEPASGWLDFNGDGYDDLAIGSPRDDVGAAAGAGSVHVLYGSEDGLSSAGSDRWTQGSANVADDPEAGDRFGFALTTGDFDGDDLADLAIGAPGEDLEGDADVGAINLLFGSPAGLIARADQPLISESVSTVDAGKEFGYSLASLDIWRASDGAWVSDGISELAAGRPGLVVSGEADSGGLWIGAGGKIVPTFENVRETFYHRGPDAGARLGAALAAGDFDDDPLDDLAVSAPGRDEQPADPTTAGELAQDIGEVRIFYNQSPFPTTEPIWQDGTGLPGSPEAGDRIGLSLAAGDVTGDGCDDLAIGVPREDVGTVVDAGMVTLVPCVSAASGLDPSLAADLTEATPGIPGSLGAGDAFGSAFAFGDFGKPTSGTGVIDLAIGVPRDDVAGAASAGAVVVLYNNGDGFGPSGNQRWTQASTDVNDTAETNDRFGTVLHSADFNDKGGFDLAIGIPREDIGAIGDAGALSVLYGKSASGLGAAGDDFWHEGTSGVPGSPTASDRFGSSLP